MQTLSRFAITAAFTLTCFTVPVALAGAAPGESGGTATASGLGAAGDPAQAVVSKGSTGTATPPAVQAPSVPAETSAPTVRSGSAGVARDWVMASATPLTLGKSGWGPGTDKAGEVKSLQEEFRQAQREVIEQLRTRLKQLRDVPSEERARMREQILQEYSVIREQLIERQKQVRDEIKRRFEEFKREHPEHEEFIEDAKERLKEKVRDRRGYEFE